MWSFAFALKCKQKNAFESNNFQIVHSAALANIHAAQVHCRWICDTIQIVFAPSVEWCFFCARPKLFHYLSFLFFLSFLFSCIFRNLNVLLSLEGQCVCVRVCEIPSDHWNSVQSNGRNRITLCTRCSAIKITGVR